MLQVPIGACAAAAIRGRPQPAAARQPKRRYGATGPEIDRASQAGIDTLAGQVSAVLALAPVHVSI